MAKSKGLNEWSLTFLRIVLGFIFAYHGYLKLFVPGGFTGTISFFASINMPLPAYSALLVGIIEFVSGLFLIAGFMMRWASLLLLINMAVAFFTVHVRHGILVSKNGYEFVLVLMASLVFLIFNGGGKISLGKMFRGRHWK